MHDSSGGSKTLRGDAHIRQGQQSARFVGGLFEEVHQLGAGFLKLTFAGQDGGQLRDQHFFVVVLFQQRPQQLLGRVGLIVDQLLDANHVRQDVLTAKFELLPVAADAGGIRIVSHDVACLVVWAE